MYKDKSKEYSDYSNIFVTYAKKHRDIIENFGRYPHRNEVLGRESTPEEIEYLRDAERFGQ